MPEPKYMNETMAAKALQISRKRVRELCAAGRIPGAFDITERKKKSWRIPVNTVVLPTVKPFILENPFIGMSPDEIKQAITENRFPDYTEQFMIENGLS